MFDKVNLQSALNKQRELDRRRPAEDVLKEFKSLFEADWERDHRLRCALQTRTEPDELPGPEGLEPERIYDLGSIRKICGKYRLRFLGTESFRGEIPQAALTQIKKAERLMGRTLEAFMIMAPAPMFTLKDANSDPLLFAPLSDGRYYLLARWGNDMSWHRALLAWPLRTPVHLLSTVLALSVLISLWVPTAWLYDQPLGYFNFFRLVAFGVVATIVSGLVSYFWLVTCQKFSGHAWNSPNFN